MEFEQITISSLEKLNNDFRAALQEAAVSGDLTKAKTIKEILSKQIATMRQKLEDPFELRLRQDLAKEHNFNFVDEFKEGWARAKRRFLDQPSQWSFVNRKGELLTNHNKAPHNFIETSNFSHGYARVRLSNNLYTFINPEGKLFKKMYHLAEPFSEGYAVALNYHNNHSNHNFFLDTNLNQTPIRVKDVTSLQTYSLNDGLAKVSFEVNPHRYINYITPQQELLLIRNCVAATDFSEGVASVVPKGMTDFIFIDTNGDVLYQNTWEETKRFKQGLCPVKFEKKWGYINKDGLFAIPNQYKVANEFSNGLARVETSEHSSFINTSGNVVLTAEKGWKFTECFTGGVANYTNFSSAVLESYYIDRNGNRVF